MSKVIESLTPEQEAKLDVYYEKWLKIGLQTGRMTDDEKGKISSCINKIYTNQNLKTPEILFVQSPQEAVTKIKELSKGEIKNPLNDAAYGQHDANWLGFYDFMRNELGLKEETEELVPIIELANFCNWWFPYEEVCLVSERPIFISTNERGDLHNTTRAAIEYADGFGLYEMNGVTCPKSLILTPASELNPQDIMKIDNVEVRKEAIKKVGHSRMFSELKTKVHDKFEDYELIEFDGLYNKPYAPFLKMINPTTGEIHVEGVSQSCTTVQQALAEKWGLEAYSTPGVRT